MLGTIAIIFSYPLRAWLVFFVPHERLDSH